MSLVDYVYIQSQIADLLRKCKCTKISIVNIEGAEVDTTQVNTIQILEDGTVYFVACDGTSVAIGLNIGNSDLTLSGDRVLDGDGNTLTFEDLDIFLVQTGNNYFEFDSTQGIESYIEGVGGNTTFNQTDTSVSLTASDGVTDGHLDVLADQVKISHVPITQIFDSVAANATGFETVRKIFDLQTGSTQSWNEGIASLDNAGSTTNNFVYSRGFNLTAAGTRIDNTRVGWGESWEFHYEPTTGDIFVEKHIFLVDLADVQHRLGSFTIDTGDLTSWDLFNTLSKFSIKNPTDDAQYFSIENNGTTGSVLNLTGSASQDGVSFILDAFATSLSVTPQGFAGTSKYVFFDTGWDGMNLPAFTSYITGGTYANRARQNLVGWGDNDTTLGIQGFRFSDIEGCAVKITNPSSYADVYFETTDAGVTTTKRGYLTTSAAASLSLSTAGVYVFTGTTTTASLPTVAASLIGQEFRIKNRGSGNVTVDVTGGASTIYDTSVVSSLVIAAGGYRDFILDGTYWVAM